MRSIVIGSLAMALWAMLSDICLAIDTERLQRAWPGQVVRQVEVGRSEVRWRQYASRAEGLFAGVAFTAPADRARVWRMATDYDGIGRITPGVLAVRYLERQPTRHVIQVDLKVFWKTLRLTFEVEQEPPNAVRFQLMHQRVGTYRGVCVFQEVPSANGDPSMHTRVELSTWYQPSRPVPMRLLLLVERMTLLQGTRSFLRACENTPTI